MPRGEPFRLWVAELCYPGRAPVYYGTITVRHGAPHQEIEAEVCKRFATHIPEGWPMPEVTKLIPGHIIFVREDE